jgi:LacI family transcriptional regulator
MITLRHKDKKLPTIKEVAQLAGVSAITVSRVQTGSSTVSPKTRIKVLEAIQETGYKRFLAASNLARQKSETIAIIKEAESITSSNVEGTVLTESVAHVLNEYGYRLVLDTIPSRSSREELTHMAVLKNIGIDGLILRVVNQSRDFQSVVASLDIPHIFVNPTYHETYNAVMCDDALVGNMATSYLIQRGHRNIGYVPHIQQTPHASRYDRLTGYSQAVVGAGLERIHLEEFFSRPVDTAESIYGPQYVNCIRHYREKYYCTAVVTYDAATAVVVWIACRELNLRVPEDISIISCDYDPITQIAMLPITCFQFDRAEMGKLAVEMLLERIENHKKDVQSVWVRGDLKEGMSVASVNPF